MLQALVALPSRDGRVHRIIGCAGGRQRAIVDAKTPDRVFVENDLADRQQLAGFQLRGRSLARHIEGADAIDLVAEKVDAQRLVVARRKQVDNAASDGVIAPIGDGLDAGKTECVSCSTRAAGSSRSPRRITAMRPRISDAGGTRCSAAEIVVSRMHGWPEATDGSLLSVSIRRPAISGLGETRSYGRQSQAGNSSRSISGTKKARASASSARRTSSLAMTTTHRPASCAILPMTTASCPAGAPAIRTRRPGASVSGQDQGARRRIETPRGTHDGWSSSAGTGSRPVIQL